MAHVQALPGNPYDRHTPASVIPALEATEGHHAPTEKRLRVYVAGQKRRLTAAIRRAFRRRAAVEPVIGHLKAEHRMGRNHLAHSAGDAINAVLAAVGYNFSLLLRWLAALLCALVLLLAGNAPSPQRA